jgi:adenylate cyclase
MAFSKVRIHSILFSIVYWMLAGFYFIAVRYVGIEYAPPDLNYRDLAMYAGVVGFSIGLLFALVPINKVLGLKKRRSFLSVILLGTACYVLFFAGVIFMASLWGNSMSFALHYLSSAEGLITLLVLFASSLLYTFILQINKKFGPGILLEYVTGKYFAPKVEERAFMFMDLKSSTTIAEKLEHVSYSRLVQDCYAELTTPLLQYNAEVYQYVGDEVVVTWRMNNNFSASWCYQFALAFQARLEAKKEYFLMMYGVSPQFKAGAHCGRVTVAEVGEIKTEIAYHGDVLNTASRIQGLCNQFGKQLLISEQLLSLLSEADQTKAVFVAEAELKGKETPTRIFTIERSLD